MLQFRPFILRTRSLRPSKFILMVKGSLGLPNLAQWLFFFKFQKELKVKHHNTFLLKSRPLEQVRTKHQQENEPFWNANYVPPDTPSPTSDPASNPTSTHSLIREEQDPYLILIFTILELERDALNKIIAFLATFPTCPKCFSKAYIKLLFTKIGERYQ